MRPFGTKGIVGDFLVKFWAYILLALVITAFAFMYSLNKPKKVVIEGMESNLDTNTMLLNYLRTPLHYTLDGNEHSTTIGDFLIDSSYGNSLSAQQLNSILGPKTQEIFNKFPNIKWRLLYSKAPPSDKRENILFADDSDTGSNQRPTTVKTLGRSCLILPNPAISADLKVELIVLNSALQATSQELMDYQSNAYMTFSC